jgi:hypothetical protein
MDSRLACVVFAFCNWASLALLAALLVVSGTCAFAENRLALIVGNGAYTDVSRLDNPVTDAADMAEALRNVGFDVTLLLDADQAALNRGIAQFGRALRDAGRDATGLFYYAGHGVQSFGTNYLVPIDASLKNAADLDLVAVAADSVLRQMQSARNKTNIVILDACRDNPFKTVADIDDNGLAEMKAPTGTFLAYATAPGSVALDGLDGNSPFTEALLRNIPRAGLPIEQVFKQVRVEVLESTMGRQVPWDASSLTGNFTFLDETEAEVADKGLEPVWTAVRDSRDPLQILLFLRAHPESSFATQARVLLNQLMVAELSPPAPATAPAPSVPEPAHTDPVDVPVATLPPETPLETTPAQAEERTMIDAARTSGLATDYTAYLDVFPKGTYAELAQFELALLAKQAKPDVMAALTNGDRALQLAIPSEELEPAAATHMVTFVDPLEIGGVGIAGASLETLIKGSPRFPPIEWLPDSVWKNATCSDCHQWTREALCTQAQTYLTNSAPEFLEKPHPFGGGFKTNLQAWAEDDCQ